MNKEVILDALNSRYCCLKEPSAALQQAYDRRYLTSLHVFGTREDDEPQSPQTLGRNIIDSQILKKKITATISDLSFRDPHVLVQFWSPDTFRKRCVLTTLDQPFGIGVVNQPLYKYRLESEQRMFAVDGKHIEEPGGSPGRVYLQKLPEWSLDIKGLPTSQNIKDSNACYNIHGYLSLPVLDPASGCFVGVLELITVSKHLDYAFEVLEISKALKGQDLKTSNAFEDPSFCELPSEDRQIQVAKINDILKVMCDTHNLPLAQTWEPSPLGSYVWHEKSIQKSCSSFNRRCIGKVCMSTAGLPFYVPDQSMWEFHKACKEEHLEKSRGVVGTALLSHRVSYCENVTKLSEEEYPLVHNACKSSLGGCFAIFLHGVAGKNDYILEFFMPLDIKGCIDSYVLNLVQKLKLKIEDASGFEMGDISSMEVIRPSSVVNNISSMTEVDTPNEIIPNPFVTNVATIGCGAYANVSMQKTRHKGNDAGEPSNRNIKPKSGSLAMEVVEKQFGRPMGKNDYILELFMPLDIKGSIDNYVVNTMQKLKLNIEEAIGYRMGGMSMEVIRPSWVDNYISSMTEVDTPNEIIPHPFVTNVATIACGAYANVSMQKTRDKGNDAGEPSNRNIKPKSGSLTMEAVEKQFGRPMVEACKSLGVSRSTLKRFSRKNGIPSWPTPKLRDRSACGTHSNQHLAVSKRKLEDGREIAVKKLSQSSSQGNQEFLDEVNLSAHVQRYSEYLPFSLYVLIRRPERIYVRMLRFKSKNEDWKILSHYHHEDCHRIIRRFINSLQSDPLVPRTAMAHQNDPVVFASTTYMERATNNVDPLMARTAMAHQNDPAVFNNNTTYMEQATNNVEPHMDVDLDKVADLNCVDAFPRLSGADFIDDQGSILEMAGCGSGSVHDFHMEPDGIENPMAEIGMGLEGAWPSPIGSADMYLFGANPSGWYQSHLSEDLSFSTTVGIRGRFLSKPTLHVYHIAKLIVCLRRWKKRSFARIAMAHQDDSLVFENTANTEQATNNVDPLMARTAMAQQNDPAVFNNNTTYMEQATNNADLLMDDDLDKVTDLNRVDAFPWLIGADFIDDQGSFLKMAGCSSGSVHDFHIEPDGIENPMAEIGMGLEGALFSPIGSGDMSLFDANNFNLISDD